MRIWAIADLHLSFARPDRRERFAGRWRDHAEAIGRHWGEAVGPGDLVLLPGDLSMARNHRDLQADLAWLDRLPGTKVLAPGNHDAWWNRVDEVRPMLRRSLLAVEGDALLVRGVVVCGARGAPVLGDEPEPDRRAASDRELASIEAALDHAARLRGPGQPLYVLWHFPPFDARKRPGPVASRLEAAGVTACVYGHLHAEGQWATAPQGTVRGVRYRCVAADSLGFRPLRIDRERGPGATRTR